MPRGSADFAADDSAFCLCGPQASAAAARALIGKKVALPDGRIGVVKSSGNGFLAVQVDKAGGGHESVNVRPKAVVASEQGRDGVVPGRTPWT